MSASRIECTFTKAGAVPRATRCIGSSRAAGARRGHCGGWLLRRAWCRYAQGAEPARRGAGVGGTRTSRGFARLPTRSNDDGAQTRSGERGEAVGGRTHTQVTSAGVQAGAAVLYVTRSQRGTQPSGVAISARDAESEVRVGPCPGRGKAHAHVKSCVCPGGAGGGGQRHWAGAATPARASERRDLSAARVRRGYCLLAIEHS
eukprot:1516381-Prymnesium_polylepis.1